MGRPCLCCATSCESCTTCINLDKYLNDNQCRYILILSNYDPTHSGPPYSTWGNGYSIIINPKMTTGIPVGSFDIGYSDPLPVDSITRPDFRHIIWNFGDTSKTKSENLYKYIYYRNLLKCYDASWEFGDPTPFGSPERYPSNDNIKIYNYSVKDQNLFTESFFIDIILSIGGDREFPLVDTYFKTGILTLWRLVGNYSSDEWDSWVYDKETQKPISIPQKYQLCLLFYQQISFLNGENIKQLYGAAGPAQIPVANYSLANLIFEPSFDIPPVQKICCLE